MTLPADLSKILDTETLMPWKPTRRELLDNLLIFAAIVAVGWVAYRWGYGNGWDDAIRAVIDAHRAHLWCMFNQPQGGDSMSHKKSSVSKGFGISGSSEQPLA